MRQVRSSADHRGAFAYQHDNPPPPFNPTFDPAARARYERVTSSLVAEDFYASRSREECKAEWARRYEELLRQETVR